MNYVLAMLTGSLVTAGIALAATSPYYGWCFVLAFLTAGLGAIIENVK